MNKSEYNFMCQLILAIVIGFFILGAIMVAALCLSVIGSGNVTKDTKVSCFDNNWNIIENTVCIEQCSEFGSIFDANACNYRINNNKEVLHERTRKTYRD